MRRRTRLERHDDSAEWVAARKAAVGDERDASQTSGQQELHRQHHKDDDILRSHLARIASDLVPRLPVRQLHCDPASTEICEQLTSPKLAHQS